MKSSMTRLPISLPARLSIPFSLPLSARLFADLSIALSNRLFNCLLHRFFNPLFNRSFTHPFNPPFLRLFPSLSTGLFFCLSLPLSSCQSPAAVSVLTHRTDSVYIDKLIPYPLPSDSASIRALMECDENGQIALRQLEMANTKNVQLHFSVDSLGKVITHMKITRDTLYLPSKETIVVQEIEYPVAVATPLSYWENFKRKVGGWAIGSLTGLTIMAAIYASIRLIVRKRLRLP